MLIFDGVTRDHVLLSLAEHDERGATDFLEEYGFHQARESILWYDGRSYDVKPILGVALKYATGEAATSAEFSGGRHGAAKKLQELGFRVTSDDDLHAADAPAHGEWVDISEVGADAARDAWAASAREVLLETARHYQALVTQKDLATQVQHRTGTRTKQPMHYWIGDVLGRVAAESASRGEPLLSSLCVNATESMGEAYALAVTAARGELPDDPDDHAARERLACYTHFEAEGLPADGGAPTLTAKVAAARARNAKARQVAKPMDTCPTCHMGIPATGVCDNCD